MRLRFLAPIAALLGLLTAIDFQASAQTPAAPPVAVYPSPGTISASTATQISFRNRSLAELGPISVRGSRSGTARGSLRAHSDGRGASWLPRRRFKAGETVTVRTGLDIAGARDGEFRFRIGRFPKRVQIRNIILEDIPPGRTLRYRSRPDLAPPKVTVDSPPGRTEPGDVFLTPKSKKDLKQAGPMIVDNAGQPIWFLPLPGIEAATDFRAQTYRGKPVLTYWAGTSRQGIGVGDLVLLDQSYKLIRRIHTLNGFRPDLHEFLITPQDTALLISYPSVRTDLSAFGGNRHGLAVDSVVQEVDLATGLVIFEWHSLGKIALSESFTKPQSKRRNVPWDYAHANSVGLDSDGNILLSARSTWTGYKINRQTGHILWRLGGKKSSFALGPGVKFAWQHDFRRRADGAITVFDNSAFPPVRKRSRALAIRLDVPARTATLLSAHTHPRGLLVATQGDQQPLPGGGSFVGWGSQRWFNEFDAAGKVVWDARLSTGFETYRAYRLPWVGTPATRPRVAGVARRGSRMDVYATWNGSTQVASWEVIGGSSPARMTPIGSAPRSGFETRIRVEDRTRYVAARARDAAGTLLSTSLARRVR